MPGYLRLSAKLEGQGVRGVGVDDDQIRLLGVEVEDEVRLASLDGAPQGPKVQTSVRFPHHHLLYFLSPAFFKGHCLTDATLWHGEKRHTSRPTCFGYRVFCDDVRWHHPVGVPVETPGP